MSRTGTSGVGLVVLAAASAVVVACAGPPAGAARPLIRVSYSASPDFDDLPSLIAHAALEAQGYQVEETYFTISELGAEALARGTVEFSTGSARSFWAAAGRGASLRTVMEHVGNVHRLVAIPEIASCHDLAGRRLTLQSEGAVGTALAYGYFAEACPDWTPRPLFVPQSENRAAALLSGNIDAAVLELSMFLWLEQRAPGRFRIVEDFSARWPHLLSAGVHVNGDFAKSHPDAVRDYVRARVAANRAVLADRSLLVKEAQRAIGASTDWTAIADAYVAAAVFHADGGLTADAVARSLAFFQTRSGLEPSLTPDDVADVSFLTRALADLSGAPGLLARRWSR